MTKVTTGCATSSETLRLCLPAEPRPAPPGALSASAVFGWRALLKIRHVPEQLLDVIAIPVVFTLMFTYLFGGALAGSTGRYLQFIPPGTLVMAVLLVTMYAGVGLNADTSKGISDRFRSLPIWRPAPIAGALLGDVARYLLAASLVIVLGVAMGWLRAFVKINPVSHLVMAERALLGGQAAAGQAAWVLLATAALVTVFAPITVYLYGRQR
jgi:ABC-2 type transport system permease protein